jgi:uncharacterized membrane protein
VNVEAVVVLGLGTLLLLALAAPLLSLLALTRLSRLEKRTEELDARLARLLRGEGLGASVPPAAESPGAAFSPPERAPAGVAPPATATRTDGDAAAPSADITAGPRPAGAPSGSGGPTTAAAEGPAETEPPPTPTRRAAPTRRASSLDFATSLGPRILVGAGGLAVVVFLGFFVRYAWENNWVGPAGRVLSGAVFSLGLVAAGLRFVQGVYRPLGQGLAAAGFSGLYVSAYAAHGFYDLVPRTLAGAVMVVVTACAVAVADRLRTRLLAALAWVGGYLTPVLLSTREDRAESLFGYLLLLGAGAMWLDRRKPWPETLPLAFLGTASLYLGWYASHFRPERFEVAAAGLVLFTGLFGLGAAMKDRAAGVAGVVATAAVGLALLGADADRPEVLLPLSLVLVAVGLRAAVSLGTGVALAAGLAAGLPFLAWALHHYDGDAFGLAAAWVVGGGALLVLGTPARLPRTAFSGAALVAGGVVAATMAGKTDRPEAVLVLLVAQAGVAVLARRRWAWAEAVGVALAALAVFAWWDAFFEIDRTGDLMMLGLVLAAAYAAAVAVRGLTRAGPLRVADGVTQATAAALAWLVLDHGLGLVAPGLRGPAAVSLALVHLALGLAARRAGGQVLWARVTLSLAAVFLTLAIPVQLGLFGITLAWAFEALVFLWVGVHHGSRLARVGGYLLLLLAAGRLVARHFPLHDGGFTPVLNPVFGTWLLVIASLALARRLTSPSRAEGQSLDQVAGFVLGPLGLALLFGLLTAETREVFEEKVRLARAAGDDATVLAARRQADLALSVLWTAFATGLLATGLALRSRALFYTAYALFGVTALKVVMIDLATLPTLYRMLSFLALGVLLLAGAWLNLRFRDRLVTPEDGE